MYVPTRVNPTFAFKDQLNGNIIYECISLYKVLITISILVNDFGPGPKSFTKPERPKSVYPKHVLMLKGDLGIW